MFRQEFKITPKYAQWFLKSMTARVNIIEGPIRTGKDYISVLAYVERIIGYEGSAKHFLLSAVNMKQAYLILGEYIINYLQDNARRCKVGYADAIAVKATSGTKYIVFAGGKNKGTAEEIQGLTLGGAYATEINLLNAEFITELFNRIGDAGIEGFIFGTLNPLNPEHYFYKDFLDLWEREPEDWFLNYMHTTLDEAPNMTPDKIMLLKKGRDPNSISYRRDILGLRVSAEGAIYTIADEHILEKYEPAHYTRIVAVADPGYTTSGTGFIIAGLAFNLDLRQVEMHVLKEYYHRNDNYNAANKKLVGEYVDDFMRFITAAANEFKKYPEEIYVDTDAGFTSILQQRLREQGKSDNTRTPKKGGELFGIDARIKTGQSLLFQGKLRFYKECKRTIEMFKTVEYDPRSFKADGKLQRLDDPKANKSVDMIDATEYAFNHFYRELVE